MIVQPQDVFATALGLAGLPVPKGIDSHDVRALARDGKAGPRQVAVAGGVAGPKWAKDGAVVCTVFDGEWYYELTAKPEQDRLTRMYGTEEESAEHADVAARLREAGLAELARRGTDPRLMDWLRSDGSAAFPTDARFSDAHPAPPGWRSYFHSIYHGGVPRQ
jgi:hypothetical protein